MVARRMLPSLSIGMGPLAMTALDLILSGSYRRYLLPDDTERELDALGKFRSRMHAFDFDTQLNHCSRDRRRNSGKNRLGSEQLHGRCRLQNVIGNFGID